MSRAYRGDDRVDSCVPRVGKKHINGHFEIVIGRREPYPGFFYRGCACHRHEILLTVHHFDSQPLMWELFQAFLRCLHCLGGLCGIYAPKRDRTDRASKSTPTPRLLHSTLLLQAIRSMNS
jgi:hypothetical protein